VFINSLRYEREAEESGRRQRENMALPVSLLDSLKSSDFTNYVDYVHEKQSTDEVDGDVLHTTLSSLQSNPPPPTPTAILDILHKAAIENNTVENVLEDLDSYPSLSKCFKEAESRFVHYCLYLHNCYVML
jgi:hypothetical protein